VDRPDLLDLMETVYRHPRMWLPSEHYAAYVGFLTALDLASDSKLLDGFGRWLAGGRETATIWWGQIERKVTGAADGPGGVSDMVQRLDAEVGSKCVTALMEALRAFLGQCP
jgi:hypothetical protein